MKRLIPALLILAFLVSGCTVSFRIGDLFQPEEKKHQQLLPHSVKDSNLKLYYGTRKGKEGRDLVVSFQNISNAFMRDLQIGITSMGGDVRINESFSAGNLKVHRSAEFRIPLPETFTGRITLQYQFIPVNESHIISTDTTSGVPEERDAEIRPLEGTLFIDIR